MDDQLPKICFRRRNRKYSGLNKLQQRFDRKDDESRVPPLPDNAYGLQYIYTRQDRGDSWPSLDEVKDVENNVLAAKQYCPHKRKKRKKRISLDTMRLKSNEILGELFAVIDSDCDIPVRRHNDCDIPVRRHNSCDIPVRRHNDCDIPVRRHNSCDIPVRRHDKCVIISEDSDTSDQSLPMKEVIKSPLFKHRIGVFDLLSSIKSNREFKRMKDCYVSLSNCDTLNMIPSSTAEEKDICKTCPKETPDPLSCNDSAGHISEDSCNLKSKLDKRHFMDILPSNYEVPLNVSSPKHSHSGLNYSFRSSEYSDISSDTDDDQPKPFPITLSVRNTLEMFQRVFSVDNGLHIKEAFSFLINEAVQLTNNRNIPWDEDMLLYDDGMKVKKPIMSFDRELYTRDDILTDRILSAEMDGEVSGFKELERSEMDGEVLVIDELESLEMDEEVSLINNLERSEMNRQVSSIDELDRSEMDGQVSAMNAIERSEMDGEVLVIDELESLEMDGQVSLINNLERSEMNRQVSSIDELDRSEMDGQVSAMNEIERSEMDGEVLVIDESESSEIDGEVSLINSLERSEMNRQASSIDELDWSEMDGGVSLINSLERSEMNRQVSSISELDRSEMDGEASLINSLERSEMNGHVSAISELETLEMVGKLSVINELENPEMDREMSVIKELERSEIDREGSVIKELESSEMDREVSAINELESSERDGKLTLINELDCKMNKLEYLKDLDNDELPDLLSPDNINWLVTVTVSSYRSESPEIPKLVAISPLLFKFDKLLKSSASMDTQSLELHQNKSTVTESPAMPVITPIISSVTDSPAKTQILTPVLRRTAKKRKVRCRNPKKHVKQLNLDLQPVDLELQSSVSMNSADLDDLKHVKRSNQLCHYTRNYCFTNNKTRKCMLPLINISLLEECQENDVIVFNPFFFFLSRFHTNFLIPPHITELVIHNLLLNEDASLHHFHSAKNILTKIVKTDSSAVEVRWSDIHNSITSQLNGDLSCKNTKELLRNETYLDLIVNVLKADLYVRDLSSPSELQSSKAYRVLSRDLSPARRDIVRHIQQTLHCLVNNTTQTGCSALMKLLNLLQELLGLCVEVSSSCLDCAVSLARDLKNIYAYLPDFATKCLLLQSCSSELVLFQLSELLLETQFDNTQPLCQFSLQTIIECFFKAEPQIDVHTLTNTSSHDLGATLTSMSPCRYLLDQIEELVMLIYLVTKSYLQVSKDKSYLSLHMRSKFQSEDLTLDEADVALLQKWVGYVQTFQKHVTGLETDLTARTSQYLMLLECLVDVVHYPKDNPEIPKKKWHHRYI